MEEKRNYKYYAFISYTETDYDMVKWLQRKLEFYHIPVEIRKKHPDLPKKWKVFEYKSEMKGGYLWEEIQKRLDDSKYLIVVCSPNTPKSTSVEKEINYFKDLDREAQIIPFVIEGEAYSTDPDKECFPEPLRNTGLRGISINELGRDAAAVKVVAQMFGLEFDELWQRYNKEMKRKRNIVFFSVIACAIVASLVALWMWHLNNQIILTNKKLIKENIRISSSGVLNLLEKGQLIDAEHQVESIVDLWNRECRQEVPEMEKALRALYRYQWKDGIIKLYSKPLSDKQRFLSADSNYLYICDNNENGERIVSYSIANGDSAKQVFPQEGKKLNYSILDFNHGLVICESNNTYQVQDGAYRKFENTIYVYDQKSGKQVIKKVGIYTRESILNEDKMMFEQYDTLSKKLYLEVVDVNSGQTICQWKSPFKNDFDAAFLNNDSLTIIGDNKVVVYSLIDGNKLMDIDYKSEKMEMGYNNFGNSNVSKLTKQYANSSEFGLRLFSTKKKETVVLDKSRNYSYIAYNPSGTMLAAAKESNSKEKDSILVFIEGFEIPIFSIEGDYFGSISFADNNIFVEYSYNHNRINVFCCEADYCVRQLFSSTGNYFIMFEEGSGNVVIVNDSTNENICTFKNRDYKISNVYEFSPQDTYLIYATSKNPIVMHHIKKNTDVVIPFLWENLKNRSFDFYISSDESRLLFIVHYTTNDLIVLYDISKDVKVITSARMTGDISCLLRYALSANGSKMALSDGSKVHVFGIDSIPDMSNDLVLEELGNSSVRELRFFNEDSLLAASYSDGTIRFWETNTGIQMYTTIHTGTDGNLNFDISSDSQYLVGTNHNDIINNNCEYLVWHIPSGILVDKETNAWSWWATPICQELYKESFLRPYYRAHFSRNSNEIIANEYKLLGLSRKFSFPSFDELIELYSKQQDRRDFSAVTQKVN